MKWTLNGNAVGDLEYAYDADGRVIQKTGSLASAQLPSPVSGNTFNADNEMTAFNGATLTYDADGNLTSDGTNSYLWDTRGHLSTLAGTNVAAYQYDAFGRRVQNTLNGLMTHYLYDGLNPVEEFDGSSPPNVTATTLTGLNIDEYFQRVDSSGTMSYLTDMLGSTLALADSSGALDTTYTYDPFGNVTVNGADTNPYQFTGRENDGTGLYYYRARYYSPTLQRFVSQDPAGFAGSGMDPYGYVANSPLVFVDPLGLYFDFNITVGEGLVGTVGVQWDNSGISVYAGTGAGFGSPVSFSLMADTADAPVSPGVQFGIQGVVPGAAGQIGVGPNGLFAEGGVGVGLGGSATLYGVSRYLYRFPNAGPSCPRGSGPQTPEYRRPPYPEYHIAPPGE